MKIIHAALLLLMLPTCLPAQNLAATSAFKRFEKEGFLEITLKSDFENLKKNKRKDDYQPASVSFVDKDGQTVNWELEIKPRGKMRRMVCSMPPLKLRFPKEAEVSVGKLEIRTLEMVEICDNIQKYEQYVLKEYMIYKLYNMLTELSFRVQLVQIKYENTSNKHSPMDGFGFIIENNEEVAERLGGQIVEPESYGRRLPNTHQKEIFCLFQFMIGNTDWFTTTAHNLDIFSKNDGSQPIPIPYDFDYSGFVNTTYAVPNDKTPLKYVTDRFYQGPCMPEEETRQTIQLFLDKKQAMLDYCKTFPHLTKYTRKQAIKYLNSFFNIIENPKAVKRIIQGNCDSFESLN